MGDSTCSPYPAHCKGDGILHIFTRIPYMKYWMNGQLSSLPYVSQARYTMATVMLQYPLMYTNIPSNLFQNPAIA